MTSRLGVSRRRVLKGAGGLVATAFPASASARPAIQTASRAAVFAQAETRALRRRHRPARALHGRGARSAVCRRRSRAKRKHRILDTLGAMVSGARPHAGRDGDPLRARAGRHAEASVLTTDIRTSAVNAALANGMFAPRRRDRRFRAGHQGASRLRRRARRARDGRARRPIGHRS